MPSFLDYVKQVGPYAVSALLNRRASGGATNRLVGGTQQAADRITRTGADLAALYDPYRQLGASTTPQLQAGLLPGGGLADPYTEKFSFSGADLANEPGYQFGLAEGQKAIEAAQRALGNRFSGGAVKAATRYAENYAGTKFNEGFNRAATTFGINENTFRQNQDDRFTRLMQAAGLGLNAVNNDANARLITGQQLADLEMARAEAEASGDIGKASAITDAINGAMAGLSGLDLVDAIRGRVNPGDVPLSIGGTVDDYLKQFPSGAPGATPVTPPEIPPVAGGAAPGFFPPMTPEIPTTPLPSAPQIAGLGASAAPAVLPGVLAGGGSAAGLTGASLAGIQAGAVPALPTLPAVGLTPSIGAAPTATAPGSSGLMGAAQGLLTNPWTAVVGAGIIGTAALLKSQAHWEANTWVQGFQNKFDANMDQLNQRFNSAAQSGQLTRADAEQIRNEVAGLMDAYEQKRQDFRKQGSDERKVADQALKTFNQYYGVNGQDFLSKMDAIIAGLA